MHLASDGVPLDIQATASAADARPARVALLLPCMGGDIQGYALDDGALVASGYHVVRMNPRGHGRSGGVWSLEATLADIAHYFGAHGLAGLPVLGIGHSGGATTILTMAERVGPVERAVLLAPVLDTRLSARFKYEHATARELYVAFRPRRGDGTVLSDVLATDTWLDEGHWRAAGLRQRIDDASRDGERPDYRAGTLLENIFLPGHVKEDAFARFGARVDVCLPAQDSWFPSAHTAELAKRSGAAVHTIASGRDHFFRNGFPELAATLARIVAKAAR